jgi:transcriptional regulator with XRE-family HTH domain
MDSPEERSAFGERLRAARAAAGYASMQAVVDAGVVREYNRYARYERGEAIPRLMEAAKIARGLRVSLEWLASGEEQIAPSLVEWLEGPAGRAAPAEAVAFLKRVPLHGYQPRVVFWEVVFAAFKAGLDPDQALSAALRAERLPPSVP